MARNLQALSYQSENCGTQDVEQITMRKLSYYTNLDTTRRHGLPTPMGVIRLGKNTGGEPRKDRRKHYAIEGGEARTGGTGRRSNLLTKVWM